MPPLSPRLRPYLGRWVALIRGQVVGVGLNAEEARVAAQLARAKERCEVMFVTDSILLAWPTELTDLLAQFPPAFHSQLWLVGGAVRDVLLNRRLHDLDFAVQGDALAVARAVANQLQAAFYPLDAERGVGRVILTQPEGRLTLDFAGLRGEALEADLRGRDFTINAMAAALTAPAELIDPLNGYNDLRTHTLRACAETAIADDPVRGVRAVRLAAQLNFKIEKATRSAIRAQAQALKQVSAERRRDEFIRCLAGPRPDAALRALDLLGLLEACVPELLSLKGVTQSPPHEYEVWEHTLLVVARLAEIIALLGPVHDVDAASDLTLGLISVRLGRYRHQLTAHLQKLLSGERPVRWALMLAGLLHDVGKPTTRTVESTGRIRFWKHDEVGQKLAERRLERLRFSTDETKRVSTIVAHHMRPLLLSEEPTVSRRAIYRFFRATGEAGVDIVLHALADYLGTYGNHPPPQEKWAHFLDVCAQLLEAYFEQPEAVVRPPALITGDDLIALFGLESGPRLGQLLEAVREAQAMGEVADRAAALAFIQDKLGQQNPLK